MTTSFYGLSTATADVPNANNLTATDSGSSTVQTTGNQTFNFTGYMEVQAHGGSTGVHGAINPPDGRGWMLDNSSLVGLTFPSGDWTAKIKLATSDVSATGDLYVRFYKLNVLSIVYTAIGQVSLTAQTITTAGVAFTLTATALPAVTFNSNECLYMDIWWNQTGGGSAGTLMSVAVASTSSGVPGASGGFEIITPYSAGVVNIAGSDTLLLNDALDLSASLGGSDTLLLGDSMSLSVLLGAPTIPPVPMPRISLNAPAYSNATFYPAGQANDDNYATIWRSVTAPTAGAPYWLVYDLSGVPVSQRAQIVIEWLNEIGGQYLDTGGAFATSLASDYTIDANAAAGGTGVAPTTGWVNLVTVTGNVYTTVQHILHFSGYNWLRIQITTSLGTAPNNDVELQLDVHDAHLGIMDRWLVLGDSITNDGMLHQVVGGGAPWGYGGALSQSIAAATNGTFYPAIIDGGNVGQTMAWAQQHITGLLNGFSGGFVVLAFGTNDCNQSFQFAPGDANVTAYYTNLLACIDAAAALHNLVIVPKIPYGTANNGNLGFNANLCNAYVAEHLAIDRPAALIGPDFWTFFSNNPGLLRSDGIHPTFTEVNGAPSGYEEMHRIYTAWMLPNIYQVGFVASNPPTVLRVRDGATALRVRDGATVLRVR